MIHLHPILGEKPHILWDFNGTILNDAHLCVRAVNVLLKEASLNTITLKEYAEWFDFPVIEYYRKLGFACDRDQFADLSRRFHEMYHAWLDDAEVYPGLVTLIEQLSDRDHHVLSAAQKDDLETNLRRFGIRDHFTSVYGLDDQHAHSKVGLGLELMKEQNLNPQDCILIGDTLHDLEVGNAMGVEVVLVTGGHQSVERLRAKYDRILEREAPVLHV